MSDEAQMAAAQVIAKQRVADHGEVLTAAREVNAMLDLVPQETARIDSRFLEPACGNGNFLAVILERKLTVVEARYGRSQRDFEHYAVLAASSIYGIDILEDNVRECRHRLYDLFDASFYTRLFGSRAEERCRATVRFILERNITWGDALSLRTVGENPGTSSSRSGRLSTVVSSSAVISPFMRCSRTNGSGRRRCFLTSVRRSSSPLR
ncbi:MAG: SAM-dependent DNA methyltransferase [Bryobacteraceae bacterium]